MFGGVYMHIYGYVCHTCVCGSVHSQHAFGSQRTTLGAFFPLRLFLLLIWDRVSYWHWTLSHRPGHQAPALPEILLSLPIISDTHFILCGLWGLELRSSHMQGQHFTNWDISPPIYLQFLQQNLYLDRCETLCFLNYFLQGKYLWAQLQNC